MDEVSIGAMFMWTSQSINCCTLRFCLFFHNFKHNPGSKTKTVLEQQTLRHSLMLPDTVCITGENSFWASVMVDSSLSSLRLIS